MAHNKMYGICENKCLVEAVPKSQHEAEKQTENARDTELNNALANKLGKNETASSAVRDGAGNVIVDTYLTKAELNS